MAKKVRKKIPRAAELSRSRAAGMAAATRGRAKVIEDKRDAVPPAKKQIAEQLGEMDE
jgi:hypothetical protein